MYFRALLAAFLFTFPFAESHFRCFSLGGYAAVFKPAENGMAYGVLTSGKDIFSGNEDLISEELAYDTKVKTLQLNWDVGYGLRLCYQPRCSCLDFSAHWLHFCTDTKDSVKMQVCDGCGTFFFGTWSAALCTFFEEYGSSSLDNGILGRELQGCAKAKLKTDIDIVDLVVGHPFCPTRCLFLRPFLGIRVGLIDQDVHIKNLYLGSIATIDLDTTALAKERIKLRNDYTGCGLVVGLEGEYALGGCFAFHGAGDFSLLNGHFCIDERYKNSVATEGVDHFLKIKQKEHLHLLRAFADLKVGLRFRTGLCQNRYPLLLQINWENHFYFGQNQLCPIGMAEQQLGFIDNPQGNRGDLSLCGWTFLAQVGF